MEREKQFAQGQHAMRNRNTWLLQVLLELAPKKNSTNAMAALEIVRSSMKRMAPCEVWQYVSAMSRSGIKKISMREKMPSIKARSDEQ